MQECTLYGGTAFPPWHIYVCACIYKPLQIHASTQTYVNARRESEGLGCSRCRRRSTPVMGKILSHTQAQGGRPQGGLPLGDWHPLSLRCSPCTCCSVGSALYGTLHQIMPSTTNGLNINSWFKVLRHFFYCFFGDLVLMYLLLWGIAMWGNCFFQLI